MREQGIITKIISGNMVEVSMQKSRACDKCGLCRGLPEGMMGLEALNDVKAKIGDIVTIEIPTNAILQSSAIIFLVPVMFLFAGYLLGAYLFRIIGLAQRQEMAGVIFSLSFLAASCFVIRWYDGKAQKKKFLQARVVAFAP